MKIAIPSTGDTLTSPLSHTLGRSPFIIIYDSSTGEYDPVENPGFQIQDGSGLKASEIIVKRDADVLLTSEVGRKSYSVLMKEHIKIQLIKSGGTIKSTINKFLNKQKI